MKHPVMLSVLQGGDPGLERNWLMIFAVCLCLHRTSSCSKATTHVSGRTPNTWPSWRQWMQVCWSRNWKKRCINRVLKKRDMESCNKGSNFTANTFGRSGAIYALFHFPTGRWYVGQTIHPVHVRAQQQ